MFRAWALIALLCLPAAAQATLPPVKTTYQIGRGQVSVVEFAAFLETLIGKDNWSCEEMTKRGPDGGTLGGGRTRYTAKDADGRPYEVIETSMPDLRESQIRPAAGLTGKKGVLVMFRPGISSAQAAAVLQGLTFDHRPVKGLAFVAFHVDVPPTQAFMFDFQWGQKPEVLFVSDDI